MSMIQKISLASFIYHKHDIVLYVYDMNMSVPIGIKKVDANEIIPEDKIFLSDGSYAAFSDMFRYRMIQKTGRAWVDADTICLRPDWYFENNIFASYEIHDNEKRVANGVLGLDKDSKILEYLVDNSSISNKENLEWGELGPKLLTKAFIEFDYMKYAKPTEVFLGVQPYQSIALWTPKGRNQIAKLEKNGTYSISIYNHQATRKGYDKNIFDNRSALHFFKKRFYVGESSDGITK